jgi:4-hydroxybenzoate polyprenyltransferase
MRISFDFSALARTKWWEYAVRFLFGGAVTMGAGLAAKHFGPVVGGLFLAFPAIFPASATLVERHEREKKKKAGIQQTVRGRRAAGLDASGAAMGSAGLLVFAFLVSQLLMVWNAPAVLLTATGAWLGVSILLWRITKSHLMRGH